MAQLPRLLVVDPDPDHLSLVERSLREVGEVDSATSGEEAMALVQATDPHAVIADQRLPGMSGLELLVGAGERDEHVGRILMTNYGDTQATIDAVEGGRVDAFIPKPCMPHQLKLVVRSVIERSQLARDNARLVGRLTRKNHELLAALDSLRSAQKRVVESERLGAIGRMIAMIVHDFRGPLTVIRAAGGELAHGDLSDAERRDLGRDLLEENERMNRMCNELLDVSRASDGGISQSKEQLDGVVESALALLGCDLPRNISIEARLESRAEMMLDADRLRRAILNLGYNAIEAMPQGGVLRMSTQRETGGVRLVVEDTGVGIPENLRERIFDPFVSAGKPGGSGLGLAVVKKVVEDHGGRIELGGIEGCGAAFHIHLPSRLEP